MTKGSGELAYFLSGSVFNYNIQNIREVCAII